MASEKVKHILRSVYEKAQQLMTADRFYAVLYDPVRAQLEFPLVAENGTLVATGQELWQARPIRKDDWLTDHAVTQAPLLLLDEDLENALREMDLEYWPEEELPRSWIGAPMLVEGRGIGALVMENRHTPRAFGKREAGLLSTIAHQAAMAIENIRLSEQRDRQIANLQALHQVGQMLTSGIRMSEPEILELIYKQASQLMDTDNLYIALYDPDPSQPDSYNPKEPEKSCIYGTVRFGLMYMDGKRREVASRKAGHGRTEWIIRNQRPILILTRVESKAWYRKPGRQEYIGDPLASWVGVPMTVGETRLGVIATYHKTQHYVYDEEDQRVLLLMASQAAIAIDNARLHGTLQDQLEKKTRDVKSSREIDRAIVESMRPGPELQSVLDLILEKALERTGASSGNIMWYDKVTKDLVMRAGKGVLAGKERARQKIGEGIVGRVAQNRRTCRIGDVTAEPWKEIYIPFIPNARSELAAPLMDSEILLGVLNVEDTKLNAFDEEDARWIEDLAVRAVIAIRSAQAYEALQEEQRKSIAAGRLAAVNAVTAGFVHRLNNVAGTIPVRVAQIEELLDSGDPKYPKISDYLAAIREDVDSILRTAQAIRSSKTDEPLEFVDVDTLIATAIRRVTAPTNVTVHSRCDQGLPPVLAFSGQLVNTLENLVRNSLEAIENTGTVTVVGKALAADGQDWIGIEIRDTGKGISQEQLPRIFDLFFTTKQGGMGFALWRAKTLVESLGGKIDVHSELGKGTTFTILLPVTREVPR